MADSRPPPSGGFPDRALLARFLDAAAHLYASEELDETLFRVTRTAVAMIPACDVASVSWLEGTAVVTHAPTGHLAEQVDLVQYQTGEGPCLSASTSGHPSDRFCYTPDAAHDDRWPAFSSRVAAEHGVVSLASCRLTANSQRAEALGALNMYGLGREAFTEVDLTLALLLGAHAGAAVDASRLRAQLRAAMESRDIIGQAKGMIMVSGGLSADEAFDLLSRGSQRLNVKLRDLAADIAERRRKPFGP